MEMRRNKSHWSEAPNPLPVHPNSFLKETHSPSGSMMTFYVCAETTKNVQFHSVISKQPLLPTRKPDPAF